MKNLTASLQDYIEAIYVSKNGLRGADLSRSLNVSRASVSEALSKLVNKGLIEYKSYGIIKLTETGLVEAEKVYGKHNTLEDFFENILGIDARQACDNACEIEHIISEDVLTQISKLTYFFRDNPDFLEQFRKKS